jgi:Transcription factor WhiB
MLCVAAQPTRGGHVVSPEQQPYPCADDYDLFYSPDDDGRTEEGRVDREALAGIVCNSCSVMLDCLHVSLERNEVWGVWGGMGEGERRKFRSHLLNEGYSKGEFPALKTFYLYMETAPERFYGIDEDSEQAYS